MSDNNGNGEKPQAILLTADLLHSDFAKTAHGLIRTSDKYHIVGIVDHKHFGQDAGIVLDGENRGIPIYANVLQAILANDKISFAIVGVATAGGVIPEILHQDLMDAIHKGLSIINGLHTFLSEDDAFKQAATSHNVSIHDIRKPKPRSELAFWTGEIYSVTCPIISVLGTDCALGKRTTTRMITDALSQSNIAAEMIFTGQTGQIQNKGYGFILDSTVNDFVSGEMEKAIVDCFLDRKPQVILLEGQACLLNPSGPCGSEYLISANSKYVVLQHAPFRTYYEGWEELHLKIPPIDHTIQLIEHYGAKVIAITLNLPAKVEPEKVLNVTTKYQSKFGIPVLNPLTDSLQPLVDQISQLI